MRRGYQRRRRGVTTPLTPPKPPPAAPPPRPPAPPPAETPPANTSPPRRTPHALQPRSEDARAPRLARTRCCSSCRAARASDRAVSSLAKTTPAPRPERGKCLGADPERASRPMSPGPARAGMPEYTADPRVRFVMHDPGCASRQPSASTCHDGRAPRSERLVVLTCTCKVPRYPRWRGAVRASRSSAESLSCCHAHSGPWSTLAGAVAAGGTTKGRSQAPARLA